MEYILLEKRHKLELYADALDAGSPLKKLAGGYAWMTKADGKRLHGVAELSVGDQVKAYLADGAFTARVEEVQGE